MAHETVKSDRLVDIIRKFREVFRRYLNSIIICIIFSVQPCPGNKTTDQRLERCVSVSRQGSEIETKSSAGSKSSGHVKDPEMAAEPHDHTQRAGSVVLYQTPPTV